MLERGFTVLLTVALAANVYGAVIDKRNAEQPVTLLDTLSVIVNDIKAQQVANDTATTTPAPVPGKMNVCENLCPKWCQKIEGLDRNFTNCHYMCGNLCNEKIRTSNPFIGDANFEVVPSEYDFAMYDLNGDKLISVEEFASVEGIPAEEVNGMFYFSDFNRDGFIDTDEFQGGPLVFTVQMAAELSSIAMSGKTTQ